MVNYSRSLTEERMAARLEVQYAFRQENFEVWYALRYRFVLYEVCLVLPTFSLFPYLLPYLLTSLLTYLLTYLLLKMWKSWQSDTVRDLLLQASSCYAWSWKIEVASRSVMRSSSIRSDRSEEFERVQIHPQLTIKLDYYWQIRARIGSQTEKNLSYFVLSFDYTLIWSVYMPILLLLYMPNLL